MAREYYELPENATMRDMILSIRADESIHRDINHKFSDLPPDADIEHEVNAFLEQDERISKISSLERIKNTLR